MDRTITTRCCCSPPPPTLSCCCWDPPTVPAPATLHLSGTIGAIAMGVPVTESYDGTVDLTDPNDIVWYGLLRGDHNLRCSFHLQCYNATDPSYVYLFAVIYNTDNFGQEFQTVHQIGATLTPNMFGGIVCDPLVMHFNDLLGMEITLT